MWPILIGLGALLIAQGIKEGLEENRQDKKLSPLDKALEEIEELDNIDHELRNIGSKRGNTYLGSSTYRRR